MPHPALRASITAPSVSLSAPVSAVRGIGEKRAAALQQAGVHTVEDLLYHIPRQYLDRRQLMPISRLVPDTTATVLATVRRTSVRYGKPGRFELTVGDETGFLRCTWFGDRWVRGLRKTFAPGDELIVSGKVSFFNGKQIISPEYDILTGDGDDLLHTGRVIPVYPSSADLREVGLDSRGFRRVIKPLLDSLAGTIPETLPEAILAACRLPSLEEALSHAHFPETPEEAERARARLAFDELFYLEMILALRKQAVTTGQQGIAFQSKSPLARQLVDRLPFDLTPAQKRVIREIHADMCRPQPMNRLLQGDVGSGKTVVAVLAMLLAVESGYQAALMAPTEILAEQHSFVIRDLLDGLGVTVTFLVGGLPAKERATRRDEVATGAAQVVIGTHALIQEGVTFPKLGLVIIDEQHRFGVVQRAALRAKGGMPDVLVMTATPIPRTLALTVYGDLDVSVLDALPPGRKPITTRWVSDATRTEVYGFVRSQVEHGRQAYVVCPLVEESEKVDLKAAIAMADHLQQEVFPDRRVALLHGRMKAEEKDAIMHRFKAGAFDILVSTTVIEVGIDVPNATVMVIEQAERFGLAQLHQLRGRVGRGEHQSFCILINGVDPGQPIPDDTLRRLEVMAETQDGFRIADEDLKLRGPGEFLGTRQHGLPGLRIADIIRDHALLLTARREAFAVVERDGQLARPEHRAVREVLKRRYMDGVGLIEVG
ncbi:MAG: ATP-dependent DNA helicase RecG [Candidatus Latescibacteria bacterium]|nr:ATP-dependent DNA helicase RecG [Candidatus Latescibacterota bacterium]